MESNKIGMGPGGFCVCPQCGYKVEHQAGIPCRESICPKCKVPLVREGSYHYELAKIKDKKTAEKKKKLKTGKNEK